MNQYEIRPAVKKTNRFEWLDIADIYSDAATYFVNLGLPPLPSLLSTLTTPIWILGDISRIKGPLITSACKPRINLLTLTDSSKVHEVVAAIEAWTENHSFDFNTNYEFNAESLSEYMKRVFGLKEVTQMNLGHATEFLSLSDFPFAIDMLDYISLLSLSSIDRAFESYMHGEAEIAFANFKKASFYEEFLILQTKISNVDLSTWQKQIQLSIKRTIGSPRGAQATKEKSKIDHEYIRDFAEKNLDRKLWSNLSHLVKNVHAKLDEKFLNGTSEFPSKRTSVSERTVRAALNPLLTSHPELFTKKKRF